MQKFKFLPLLCIAMMLQGCFDYTYKVSNYSNYDKTNTIQHTKVHLFYGIITIDDNDIICSKDETIIYVEHGIHGWQIIATLFTGGLIDFTGIKIECGITKINNNEKTTNNGARNNPALA